MADATLPTPTTIAYDDFARLDLRVAVVGCRPHPNADKLLLVEIDLGSERGQLCADSPNRCHGHWVTAATARIARRMAL